MSKYVTLVILLITLGIISYKPARGDASEQETSSGVTDTTIELKIRQFCCKDGECKTIVEGTACGGTFEILLENLYNGLSRKNLDTGDKEIPITIIGKDGNPAAKDTNNLRLLRAIEGMLATQYGPTELLFKPHDSALIKKTKQPVTVKPLLKLRTMPTATSAEEYDTPQKINVKTEDVTFVANYDNIVKCRYIHGQFFALPINKPPKKHDVVKPIGFSEAEIERIRLEVLYKANYYRNIYGMRELQLDDNINYCSQDWANKLAEKANHLSLNSTLEHRIPDSLVEYDHYGENLFTSLPIKYVGEVAVDVCYYEVGSIQEKDKYDISMDRYEKIKRLTQLLWRVTEQIGVGAAKGKDGKYYVVMNFNPRGNIERFMKDNIPTFTQTQINEAKEKLDSINANSYILLELLEMGSGVRSLPGWKTKLYEKKILS